MRPGGLGASACPPDRAEPIGNGLPKAAINGPLHQLTVNPSRFQYVLPTAVVVGGVVISGLQSVVRVKRSDDVELLLSGFVLEHVLPEARDVGGRFSFLTWLWWRTWR